MARNIAGVAIESVPLSFMLGAAGCIAWAIHTGSAWPLLGSVVILYLVPPLLHRLHDVIAPLESGVYPVVSANYLPWWGSHQLQRLYITFPSLEAALRLVPGAYSAWLRLWGSRVGKGVYWTPRVQLLDRSLLDIGDHVVFGHEAGLTCHVIIWKNGIMSLLVKPITLETGALIGAQCGIGPGARVKAGAMVRARAEIQVNQVVE
jgi:hypothetical protein